MDAQTVTLADTHHPTRKASEYDPRSTLVSPKHQHLVTGLSYVTVWRKRRQGTFPAPIKISVGRVAWLRSDLEAWIRERQQQSK